MVDVGLQFSRDTPGPRQDRTLVLRLTFFAVPVVGPTSFVFLVKIWLQPIWEIRVSIKIKAGIRQTPLSIQLCIVTRTKAGITN